MRKQTKRVLTLLLALALCLGLLPVTALAEETPGPFTVTFDAGGGKFPDGSTAWSTQTNWTGAGNHIAENPPEPVRDGYDFIGWDLPAGGVLGSIDFTADVTVKSKWDPSQQLPPQPRPQRRNASRRGGAYHLPVPRLHPQPRAARSHPQRIYLRRLVSGGLLGFRESGRLVQRL